MSLASQFQPQAGCCKLYFKKERWTYFFQHPKSSASQALPAHKLHSKILFIASTLREDSNLLLQAQLSAPILYLLKFKVRPLKRFWAQLIAYSFARATHSSQVSELMGDFLWDCCIRNTKVQPNYHTVFFVARLLKQGCHFFNRTFCHGNRVIRFWVIWNCETELVQLIELQINANFTAAFACKAYFIELFSIHPRVTALIPTQGYTDIYT